MKLTKTIIEVNLRFLNALALAFVALAAMAQNNVAEEVAWVIGDEPIFKSDIEEQYQQAIYERVAIDGNPYCVIPEQMALDKLFLDQARIDTVEVQASSISAEVENRINFFIANLGSKEKVEEYFRMPLPRLREKLNEVYSDQYCIQQVQNELTAAIKEMRDDLSTARFGKKFADITESQREAIEQAIPVAISEAEPTKIGGK